MTEMGGTDLHVTTNSAPQIRVDGKLRPLDLPPLTAVETKQLRFLCWIAPSDPRAAATATHGSPA